MRETKRSRGKQAPAARRLASAKSIFPERGQWPDIAGRRKEREREIEKRGDRDGLFLLGFEDFGVLGATTTTMLLSRRWLYSRGCEEKRSC